MIGQESFIIQKRPQTELNFLFIIIAFTGKETDGFT